jgi:short-subunit dehydrogenase
MTTAKLVLVTGASSGIGRATAERFAAGGATALLVARNAERLNAVAAEIAAKGGKAAVFPADLADFAAVEHFAEAVRTSYGVPDVIVNNAGAGRWLPFVDTAPDEARRMIELPYLAAFAVTRAFLPAMIARRSGQVAFITSPASFMVWPNASAYIAARHALKGFAEALRIEMRGSGIDVTLVTLGTVASAYWEHNPGSRERVPKAPAWLLPELTPEQAAETIVAAVERRATRVVRPAFYRLLFAFGLNP